MIVSRSVNAGLASHEVALDRENGELRAVKGAGFDGYTMQFTRKRVIP